jgi:Flp pilus assembly protein TadG
MKFTKDSEGAVAIMVGLVLVILIGVTAFAIDFGIVFTTQKQLQNASDAGALAGARALGYYRCVESENTDCTSVNGVNTMGSESEAVVYNVVAVVGDNSAFDTSSLNVDSNTDIKLGMWSEVSNPKFTPDVSPANAVKVTTRKEAGTDNGSVRAFFGQIFNTTEYNTARESIAAITGLGSVEPGELVPIGISILACPAPEITLQGNATNNVGCVGWTNLADDSHVNANEMRDLANGSTPSPAAQVGDEIYYSGGVASNVFNALYSQWVEKRDPDGSWQILMPVYSETDCKNPTGLKVISGFATMKITYVDCVGNGPNSCVLNPGPHSDVVKGTMVCNVVEEGSGGGADFGTLGTIPGLVQ